MSTLASLRQAGKPLTILSSHSSFPALLSSPLPPSLSSFLVPLYNSRHIYVPLPSSATLTFSKDFHQLRSIQGLKASPVLSLPSSLSSHLVSLSTCAPSTSLPLSLPPLLPPPPFVVRPDLTVAPIIPPELADPSAVADCLNATYAADPALLLRDLAALAPLLPSPLTTDTELSSDLVVSLSSSAPPISASADGNVEFLLPALLHLLSVPFSSQRYLQLTSGGGACEVEKMEETGAADALVDVVEKVNVNLDALDMDLELDQEAREILKALLG
ncbi:hypothetical protein TeGR_g9891 [Tetraparma gracilis]|uniref:Uncharacterized protein n=1 Tax=Tetraparma gracilis TaxID=2962635 RepID=A0ABQ6N6K4_9STRA|nr:hypothetical protein TeGR_g9891 [Tetraparma gracilis]